MSTVNRYNQVLEIIYGAIDEVNALSTPDKALVKAPQTVVFGDGGVLDSLGLLNLLVALQDAVKAATGRSLLLLQMGGIDLASDHPLRTVQSLAEHVCANLD